MNEWIKGLTVGDKVLVEDRTGNIPVVTIETVQKILSNEDGIRSVLVGKGNELSVLAEFIVTEPKWNKHILPLPTELSNFLKAIDHVNWFNVVES